jgi:CheY-like chemotaxis protein
MIQPAPIRDLIGLKVMVVEDEALVAMVLEETLAEFGCVVTGSAATVGEALSQLEETASLDAAILDVNLGGEKVFPVADALLSRGVPFMFCTGYGPADLAFRYPQSRLLNKPYEPGTLAATLKGLGRGHGPGHRPQPGGLA